MTTITDSYTAVATQARKATEKSAETFKWGARSFADQANLVAKLPNVDLTKPVGQYFGYVQKAVDLNKDLATKWAEIVVELSGSARERAEKVNDVIKSRTGAVADAVIRQAEKIDKLGENRAARVHYQDGSERAKPDHVLTREEYEGLTKAELSSKLAERGLPKTGNLDDLVERLVASDVE